jgi:phage tail protein X
MYYYFLFRKIVFSLLVLVGIGVIILLVRFYWGSPEEQPVARLPLQSPTQHGKGGTSPLLENKLDLLKEAVPTTKTGPNPSGPAEDSDRRLSAALSESTEPKPTVPPPTIEKKPVPSAPMPEVKPSVPVPLMEAKKEPQLKEISKETKTKDSAKKTKPVPPDSKKPESKNSIQQPDKKTVMVKAGDSIYTIAEETYKVSNTSVVDRILELNPKIANPDLLPANQKIRLPEITEESLVIQSSDASVKVRLGTFMKPEYAHFLKGHPALQGKEIEITPWKTPSGRTLYRATAGKFNSREEGLEVIHNLKEKGLSPFFEGFKKKN